MNNTIGGTYPSNVISGNSTDSGVEIDGNTSIGNNVFGNLIGTDATGETSIPNRDGVVILDAPLTIVGGLDKSEVNLISGNTQNGVVIAGSNAKLDYVEGNYIGTDITGLAPLQNGGDGVRLSALTDPTYGSRAQSLDTIGGTGQVLRT